MPRSCKALRATGIKCLDFMPNPREPLRSGVCSKAVTLVAWREWHEGKWWEQREDCGGHPGMRWLVTRPGGGTGDKAR